MVYYMPLTKEYQELYERSWIRSLYENYYELIHDGDTKTADRLAELAANEGIVLIHYADVCPVCRSKLPQSMTV